MSLTEPSPSSLQPKLYVVAPFEVIGDTSLEKEWYADPIEYPRYRDNADISYGVQQGYLVPVRQTADIAPLKRFSHPAFQAHNPGFLIAGSMPAYWAFGRLWRQELERLDIVDRRLRLAAVSFIRSVARQELLVQDPTLFADPGSLHCIGAPWDLDTRSYYQQASNGELLSVSDQDKLYDPAVPEAAITVADKLHHMGVINRIIEYANTPRRCLHITPNPEVELDNWLDMASGTLQV